MKRQIVIGILLLGTFVLSSCGLKKDDNIGEKDTDDIVHVFKPEDKIKLLQTNLIDSFKSTVFAKQKTEGYFKININVNTPIGQGRLDAELSGKTIGLTGESNIKVDGSFDVKAPKIAKGTLKGNIDVISTLNKLYFKLNDFKIDSTEQQLMVYSSFIQMMKGKWLYIISNNDTIKMQQVFRNISLKDELGKYSIFKVDKKLLENKYQVSLDKQSLANIIYSIGKKQNKSFTGNVEEIKNGIGSGDILGTLELLDNNKYFIFSGNVIDKDQVKTKLNIEFTSKKILLRIDDKVDLNLARNGDNFNGIVIFKYEDKGGKKDGFSLNVSGKISSHDIEIKLGFDENNILVNFNMIGNYKDINKLNVTIPNDAVSLQELQTQMFGK